MPCIALESIHSVTGVIRVKFSSLAGSRQLFPALFFSLTGMQVHSKQELGLVTWKGR